MKALRTVAKVVQVVATVASMIPGPWQLPAMLVAAGTGIFLAATARKPSASVTGTQSEWRADPQAWVPYMMGLTFYAGLIVHRDTYGTDNQYFGNVVVYSGGGPINSIQSYQVERVDVSFSSGAATGDHAGFLWTDTQLGDCPEGSALSPHGGTLPGWGSSSKLSGYAAALWTYKFDKKGAHWQGGFPNSFGIVAEGVKVYDPRLDDTYPGGSGACRALEEDTYVYSANPALHAITWWLGRWQGTPAQRVIGVGGPVDGIDMARFVEWANVCDDNEWDVGGVISSGDDKWEALKMICQAGGAQPLRLGGLLSVDFEAPRVSLATITSADLIGEAKVVRTQPRRERINTIIARYRSPGHGWEVVSADPVSVEDFVDADGETRSRESDFPLVQDLDQVAELALYEIWNAREFGPISLPLKTVWYGYKPGDCVTLDIPELGLDCDAVIRKRGLQPETAAVQLELVSENGDKHPEVLGTAGTVAAEPDLTPTAIPTVLDLPFVQEQVLIATSGVVGLTVTATDAGASASIAIGTHTRSYTDKDVSVTGTTLTGRSFGQTYGIYYDDEPRTGGAVTFQTTTTLADSVNSAAHPHRHHVAVVTTPADGAPPTGGEGPPPGGGGGPHPY